MSTFSTSEVYFTSQKWLLDDKLKQRYNPKTIDIQGHDSHDIKKEELSGDNSNIQLWHNRI